MKCPVCKQVHRRQEYSSSPASCSHGSLLVYVTTQCPICLEDQPDPPMVALPCGHLLCQADFGRLGGHVLTEEDQHHCSNCGRRHPPIPEVSSSSEEDDDWDDEDYTDEDSDESDSEEEEEEDEEEYDDMQTPLLAETRREMIAQTTSEILEMMRFQRRVAARRYEIELEDSVSSFSWGGSSDEDDSEDESEESSVSSVEHAELRDESFPTSEPAGVTRISSTPPPPLAARSRRRRSIRRRQSHPCPDSPFVSTPATTSATSTLVTSVSRRRRRGLKGGAWLLVPDQSDNTMSTLTYKDDEHSFTLDAYSCSSRLILDGHNGVFVYAPSLSSSSAGRRSNNTWQVHHVNLQRTAKKYDVPPSASQIVSDGNSGIWALCGSKLMHFSTSFRSGRTIRKLPACSLLVVDKTGGVWIHLKQQVGGSSNINMEPGLWHFTTRSQERIMDLPGDVQCIADEHGGVWILSACEYVGALTRVRAGGDKSERSVFVGSKAAKIICDGKDGVFIHSSWYRDSRWRLSHIAETAGHKEVCYCPKDAHIVGDGTGGAWILKRGRGSPFRLLLHANRHGCVGRQDNKYPLGTVLPKT